MKFLVGASYASRGLVLGVKVLGEVIMAYDTTLFPWRPKCVGNFYGQKRNYGLGLNLYAV